MTTSIDIPVKVIEGNDALVMLGRIVNALEGTGRASAEAAPKARSLGVSLESVGNAARHLNEIREAATSMAEGLLGAAERVAQLAGEQQRLNANSQRLGLDFRQAAEGAGGFVSEMQTMQLATALANRGINVTQRELDALARVGMARAVDAGKNVEEVFDSIADSVIEGGEELEKFGTSLHGVADGTHSASERLTALAERGRDIAPAMRTAADEVAHFREELNRASRTMSEGFTDELARLATLGDPFRNASRDVQEFNREMRAVGQTSALILSQVGNALAVAVASFGVIGSFVAERFGGSRQRTDDLVAFLRGRYESMAAIANDTNDRTSVAAPPVAARGPDMVISTQEVAAADRAEEEARNGNRGGGRRRETRDELMARAISGSRPEARLALTREEMRAFSAGDDGQETRDQKDAERIRLLTEEKEATEALARAEFERSDAGLRQRVESERTARHEQEMLDYRLRAQRSFVDEMEALAGRRMTLQEHEAAFVTGSLRAVGNAYAEHLSAFIDGREELGTALQGMLADTLKAISQEAAVKAGLNLAEGFAALATYRFDAAASHFTAAGIYTGVAALAGVGAAAITPDTAKSGSAGAANDNARSATPMNSPAPSSRGDTVINVAFNGPQFGTGGVVQAAREVVDVINRGAIQGAVQINRIAVGGLR